ncbi:PAS domain-containing protein [Sphingomonas lenta]|nr:PAS domain-containing protein [Sphingomonas lenta]
MTSPEPAAEASRILALVAAECEAIKLIDRDAPLPDVLDGLLHAVERSSSDGLRCSVLLLDEAGRHLRHGAAPSLPQAYNEAIDGIAVGEGVGSCGTAAHRGTAVHVADIATDPLWTDFRELATAHGIRACWSEPVRAADGRVVATFACYYGEPREPVLADVEAIALVSRAVCFAIERSRERRDRRDDAERAALALDMAGLGTWEYRPDEDRLVWSPGLFGLYGLDPLRGDPSVAAWTELIHPDDRSHAFRPEDGAISVSREYRIRRADTGEERWVLSRSRLMEDDGGPRRFVGVSVDVTDTKRAEARLRDSERDLSLAVEAAGLGLWWLEPHADRMVATEACRDLNGFRATEIGYGEWLGMIDAADRGANRARVEAAFAGRNGGRYSNEFRLTGVDGAERVIAATGQVEDSGSGRRLVGAFRDVTAQRRAETAVRESEAKFQAIANSVDQMIWSTRPDGFHDYYNDRWYEFTGVPPGSTDGEAWNGMFHPDDQARAWTIWRRSLETGEPYHIEYRLRHRSGEYHWVIGRAQCVRDEAGRIERWYGTCTDVHDGKATETRLAQLAAVVDQSRDFVGVADPSGRPVYVNEAGRIMAGLPDLEVALSVTMLDYFAPADQERIRAEALPTARDKGYWEGEAMFRRFDDGRTFPVLYNLFPVREANGRITHFATVTRDLTEKKDSERELRRLNATLETRVAERTAEAQAAHEQVAQLQKLESLGQLTGGVAHDFNNLLTPVMGALDLIERKVGGSDERLHRIVTGAMESAERAKTLVQRLLAFARKQHLEPQAVDVAALLRGMDDLVRRSLGSRIETVIDAPASLDLVLVDPGQLELAILNLAVNARDAMPQGGRLTIAARTKQVEADDGLGLAGGEYVRLRVIDTGHGMDAETARKAVEPFYTTKGVGKGTGLGLSMAHGLAAQSGGILRIESEPGRGTAIELWLPVTVATARALADAKADAAPAMRRLTVLVVDDEELVRALTVSMLEDMGHDVIEAAGAPRALDHLRARPDIELMLTDYLMPGQTGIELARDAKRVRPDLPILLMTGYANLPEGADGGLPRLAKPFRAAELASRIDVLTGESEAITLGRRGGTTRSATDS